MRALFRDIMDIDDVQGVFFVSLRGNLVYEEFRETFDGNLKRIDWLALIKTLAGIREAEFVFRNYRLFFQSTELGYVFIIMGWGTHIALVRLNCSQALPSSPLLPTR